MNLRHTPDSNVIPARAPETRAEPGGAYPPHDTDVIAGLAGRRVFVYWNLHRHLWSARDTTTGRVILYADALTLRDATFRVSGEGRKNVHAGVVGTLAAPVPGYQQSAPTRVGYNPRKGPLFVRYDTGGAVSAAPVVHLASASSGRFYRGTLHPTPVVLAEGPRPSELR